MAHSSALVMHNECNSRMSSRKLNLDILRDLGCHGWGGGLRAKIDWKSAFS